jgi:uncharacterized membrane protein (UPF0127 family)
MPILNKISMGNDWIYPVIRSYLFSLLLLLIGTTQIFANDYTRLAVYDPVGGQWHDILAELAETPEERQIGLMHRQYLADNHGMLFIYDREKLLSFWMKNTYISLDIIYFSANGDWVSTARDTIPQSLTTYPSLAPAQFVLELPAGHASRLNIGAGSKLMIKDCNMLKSGLDFIPCYR